MSSRPPKKSEMNHFLAGGMSIEKPHPHDILSGRGGASNNHMGNKIYRTVCEHNKELYATLPRNEKLPVAVRIVEAVRSRDPPGRFLERKKEDKLWYEVTEKRAVDKTAQALREKVHKAIMLPLDEIPVNFVHLVGKETEAAALASAELAAAAAAPAPKKAKAATKKRRSYDKKTGERGSGSNKKIKIDDERFALPSQLRNISFGGLFRSAAPAGSRSDPTSSVPSMPPLPGAYTQPSLVANPTHTDPNLLVQTALAPSTSLFNLFGMLGRGTTSSTSGGVGSGIGNNAVAAATYTAEYVDDRKPSASEITSNEETSTAPLHGSPRRKKHCLTAATADARAAVETQAAVRETSLARDISSFLPSFLERGFTGLVTTATSLGTGVSGIFNGTNGGIAPSPGRNAAAAGASGGGLHITQGGAAAATGSSAISVGHDGLVVPPPPLGGLNQRNSLTGDDDFEEDPSLERLRMIPPSLNGAQNGLMMPTMPMPMSNMPTDDRKRSSLM